MAITEIPPGPPAPDPSQSRDDGTEHLHEAPILLLQLQDDLARSRKREAFWISVVAHLLIILAFILSPKIFPTQHFLVVSPAEQMLRDKDATFLELPPDAQKVTQPPKSNIISDKNRIAMSRAPKLDRQALDRLRDVRPPGAPGPGGTPSPKPAPQQAPPQMAQAQPPAQPGGGSPAPPPQTHPQPQLQTPPQAARPNPFGMGGMSPGSMISDAARAAASRGGGGGQAGDFGLGQPGQGQVRGNMEVLSDTMGVDFGPYLSRVLHDVRQNWYNLIPEVARPPLMKKGKVSITFAIMKDGRVAGMQLSGPSGDVSLDRAAWGGITASDPFPPLPGEFKGQYLALRFHFYYNPDKNDLE